MALSPEFEARIKAAQGAKAAKQPEPEQPKPKAEPPPPKPKPKPAPAPPPRQDDILRRTPPQNIQAEESVLGAVLVDNEAFHAIGKVMAGDDFYRESHRLIWRAMGELMAAGTPIDAVTLGQSLKGHEVLEQVGGSAYVAYLAGEVPVVGNAEHYARIVREMAGKRRLASVFTELASEAYNGLSLPALIGEAERQLEPVMKGGETRPYEPSDIKLAPLSLTRLYEVCDEWDRQPWVWDGILPRSSLSLIVGKSETGKSTLIYGLIHAIVKGEVFFGRQCEQGRVLYLAGDPISEIVAGKTFKAMGLEDGIQVVPGALVSSRTGLNDLRGWVRDFRPILVVGDTLAATVAIDTDKYGQSYQVQQPLTQIAREFSPNFLMAHHSQKSAIDTYNVIDAALGSVGVAAVASTRMATRMYRRGKDKFYTFEMSNLRLGRPIEGEHIVRKYDNGTMDLGDLWKSKTVEMDKDIILKCLGRQDEPVAKRTLWQDMRPKPKWEPFNEALDELFVAGKIEILAGPKGGRKYALKKGESADEN